MKHTVVAAVLSGGLLGCTVTTPLDELGSGATATSSSIASTSATSGGAGQGGAGGAPDIGGEAGGGGAPPCDYAALVLGDAPIGYWHLDEMVTPNAFDATGNHYDGLFVGGVTLGAPGAFAQAGTAVELDGATGRVDLEDRFDFAGTSSFSIEAWVYPKPGGEGSICGKLDYNGLEYSGYILFVKADGTVAFHRRPGGVAQTPSPSAAGFNHVVATYDGVTMRLYVNGVVQVNQPHAGSIADVNSPFFIGDATSWSNFEGTIDEVALYVQALSPTQVSDHYACAMR